MGRATGLQPGPEIIGLAAFNMDIEVGGVIHLVDQDRTVTDETLSTLPCVEDTRVKIQRATHGDTIKPETC